MRPNRPWPLWYWLASALLTWAPGADSNQEIDQLLAAGNYAAARTELLKLQPTPEQAAQRAVLLGIACRALDRPAEAADWLQQARKLLQQKPNPALLGTTLIELSNLNPTTAAATFEEAWQVLQTCTSQPELAADARLRYAEVCLNQADYAGARKLIEETLSWLDRPMHREHPACASSRARAEQNLGHWHLVMGDYPTALQHLQAALDISEDPIPIWGDLALAHWQSGNSAAARNAFRQALAQDSRYQVGIRANFATAALSEIDPNAPPEEILARTTEISQSLQAATLNLSSRLTLAEAQRQMAAAQSYLGQDATAALSASKQTLNDLTQQPDFLTLPVSHPLRRHAATTRWALESITTEGNSAKFAQEVITHTLAQMQALSAAKTESERLAFLDNLDLAAPVLALAPQDRLPHVPALLSSFGLALRETLTTRSLAEWQATLPPQSSFLSLFTYRQPIGQQWQTSLAALVINPTGPPILLDLDFTLTAALNQTNRLRDNLLATTTETTKILTDLGKNIWGPVAANLPTNTTRIFLFLEGPLAALPIPFLRWKEQSLLDSPLWITFLASPETLFHQAAKNIPLRPGTWLGVDASKVPVQIPAPVAGWNFPHTLMQNRPLSRLTQVGPELAAVAAQHAADWQQLTPNEKDLRQALANPNIHVWHFAGHGVSDVTASNGRPSPFSNCLVCPQVDLNLPEAENGLLFNGELASLKLSHLDLAVLSACDTGRGGSQRAEAVFDFARACHAAGVRDVLVSTTPVADPVAPVLMQAFYESVSHGMDPAEAAWKALRTISHTKPNLPAVGSFRLVRGNTSRL